jgi:hypothetical protein
MERSESIKEIATALCKAQSLMKHAKKDSANPFFKSHYADLASVMDAIREPFASQGLSFVQGIGDSEHGVAIETMIMHTSGEWLSSKYSVPVTKADAQGVGSAITYGRRYALAALCGVAAEDDDGNAAAKAAPAPPLKDVLKQKLDVPHPKQDNKTLLDDPPSTFRPAIGKQKGQLLVDHDYANLEWLLKYYQDKMNDSAHAASPYRAEWDTACLEVRAEQIRRKSLAR